MALPDRLEAVGIIVGSTLLVALPTSALGTALGGLSLDPTMALVLWFTPGLVLGTWLAVGDLPFTYHQVWVFALSSWLLTLLGWAAMGVGFPPSDSMRAVLSWVIGVGVGAYLSYRRPLSQIRGLLRSA